MLISSAVYILLALEEMGLFIRSKNPCAAALNLCILGCVLFFALILAIWAKIWYFEHTRDDMTSSWKVFISDDFWHFDALTWTLIAVFVLGIILCIHLTTGCLFCAFEGIIWMLTCQWCCAAGRKLRKWRTKKKRYRILPQDLAGSSDEEVP